MEIQLEQRSSNEASFDTLYHANTGHKVSTMLNETEKMNQYQKFDRKFLGNNHIWYVSVTILVVLLVLWNYKINTNF